MCKGLALCEREVVDDSFITYQRHVSDGHERSHRPHTGMIILVIELILSGPNSQVHEKPAPIFEQPGTSSI